MTSSDLSTRGPAAETILPPYSKDPQRPAARRMRFWVIAGTLFFCFIWGVGFALFGAFLMLFFAVPVVLLALVAIWALPDSRTAPVGWLSPMLFLFIGGLVMWPNYIAFAPPGLPWITVNRLIGIPMVLVLLVCVSTAPAFRAQLAAALKSTPVLTGLFIAFNLMEVASIFISRAPVFSLNYLVNAEINWTAIFFVSVFVFLKPGRVERMVRLLWAMSLPIGLIAIFEMRAQHPLWAGHIPSFLQIEDPAVKLAMEGNARAGIYRAAATFGVSLGLAEYISLVMPFVVQFMVGPYRPATRIAAGLSIPFLIWVVLLTGARLGLIGCFLSIALTGLVWAGQKWSRDRRSLLSPMVVLAYPAFLALSYLSTLFVGRIRALVWGGAAGQTSINARNDQWALGKPMVYHQPWGHGIGTAAETLGYAPYGLLTIDTYYLSILLEFGPLGFLIYYGTFVVGIFHCVILGLKERLSDMEFELCKPLAISILNFFIIKSVFSQVGNHAIIFMMLGMVVALAYRASCLGAPSAPASVKPPQIAMRGRSGEGAANRRSGFGRI
jgi:hypothetical protein